MNDDYFATFAEYVSDITHGEPAIVYTDFIADIGHIVSSLNEIGIEAVGYYGEMDSRDRLESYSKWKSGGVKIMVATKIFGMGINKHDIRHIIRNGVPESIVAWTQELGRAGRDGASATATIVYRKTDIRYADAWIWNNLSNKDRCRRVLEDYATSWRFTQAHLSGACRRKVLLQLFSENDENARADGQCCDVCINQDIASTDDFKEELKVLINALETVGSKGEVKVAEWIRGSALSWTEKHDKSSLSYGNHCGHGIDFWRKFMRQCHVLGLVNYELQSLIKGNGHYAVMGVYSPSEEGKQAVSEEKPLILPFACPQEKYSDTSSNSSSSSISREIVSEGKGKRKRDGKGSNILLLVRKLLKSPENWKSIGTKRDYQFLGTFPNPSVQQLYYIPNCFELEQSSHANPHYLWTDIQLSKGHLNKDQLIEVELVDINGQTKKGKNVLQISTLPRSQTLPSARL